MTQLDKDTMDIVEQLEFVTHFNSTTMIVDLCLVCGLTVTFAPTNDVSHPNVPAGTTNIMMYTVAPLIGAGVYEGI